MYVPNSDLKSLVPDLGGCVVSNKIMYDKMPIVYIYRDSPDNDMDSGWRFLSGTETDEYLDDPNNSGFYDANTIANMDETLVPYLNMPIGTELERDEDNPTVFRALE